MSAKRKKQAKPKEPLGQIRIYKHEQGIIRRLAFRKDTTAAEIIRSLIKGA